MNSAKAGSFIDDRLFELPYVCFVVYDSTMDKADVIGKLRMFFESRDECVLAFMFGSMTKGTAREESDVDIAVWLSGSDKRAFSDIWSRLENLMARDVDLIDLRSANAQIAWSALRGSRLKIKDRAVFLNLVLEKSREAEDFSEWTIDLWKLRRSNQADRKAG